MAKRRELIEQVERIEELIEELEFGELSREEGERPLEESRQKTGGDT